MKIPESVSALSPPALTTTQRRRWLSAGLAVLGVGAALVALLGPLAGDVIEYHVSDGAVDQVMGGDVAGLVLVAPLCLFGALLVWRGHRAGTVLALGPAIYALYMYSQLALGGDVVRYPGNSERFFALYLGLFVLAGGVGIVAWNATSKLSLPVTPRRLDRVFGWFAIVVALFLAGGLHLPGLIDAWAAPPASTEYLVDPGVFWLVKFMDLGLVVPAFLVVGIGALRRARWAAKAKYAVVGWAALLGSSVAGMALVMQLSGDPAGTPANTIAFGVFAAVGLVLATMVYKPLFESHR